MKMETLPTASSMYSRGPEADTVDTAQSHGRVRSANNSSSRNNNRAGLYNRSNLRQRHHQQQQQRHTNGTGEAEDDVVVQPMLERNVKTHTGRKKLCHRDKTRFTLFVKIPLNSKLCSLFKTCSQIKTCYHVSSTPARWFSVVHSDNCNDQFLCRAFSNFLFRLQDRGFWITFDPAWNEQIVAKKGFAVGECLL